MSDRRRQERQEYEYESAREWAKKHQTAGRTSLAVPEGVAMLSIKKAGNYYLDVLPYKVGKGNPDAAAGKRYWQRTYHCHRGIGPNNDTYCCPKRCVGARCPVCEDVESRADELTRTLDGEALKKAKGKLPWAKERQLMNVIDRNALEKGIQIWDISWHLFGKTLKAKLDNMDPDEDYDLFWTPRRGKTLKITATEESGGGYSYYDCSTFDFKNRKPDEYDDDVIEQTHCLDDMVKIPTYEELLRIYLQIPEDEPLPDQGNGGGGKSYRAGYSEGSGKKLVLGGKGKPAAQDDDDDDDDAPAVRRPLPLDDDDDAPPAKAASNGRKPAPQDDDDDDDDAPPPPKKAKSEAGKPPATAADAGLEEGDKVKYKNVDCEIIKVSRDGTSLTLQDDDEEVYRAVSPGEVKKIQAEAAKPGKALAAQDDDDDDAPPPPKKGKGK